MIATAAMMIISAASIAARGVQALGSSIGFNAPRLGLPDSPLRRSKPRPMYAVPAATPTTHDQFCSSHVSIGVYRPKPDIMCWRIQAVYWFRLR